MPTIRAFYCNNLAVGARYAVSLQRRIFPLNHPSIVLSHVQIKPLHKAYRAGETNAASTTDLGLSTVEVALTDTGIRYTNDEQLSWDDAEEIAESEVNCYALENAKIRKILIFSEHTRRHVSLMPTEGAPTMLIAGFPMHRIKGTDPRKDTVSKIKAAQPRGVVLDTSMGLGYTAIEAARSAERVITIELDPAVVEIARQNPYSRELFENPKIERHSRDSRELIETFDDNKFTRIIHDPPTFSLAGELYSGVYYRELFRILKRGGRLFHYIGDLHSPSGHRVMKGVINRLGEAGFIRITKRPESFGVVAHK
jgi:predicted methyltransferase